MNETEEKFKETESESILDSTTAIARNQEINSEFHKYFEQELD